MIGDKKETGSASSLSPGTRFGKFYLQELVNTGGMADIWLVTDSSQKAYALRRMHDKNWLNFSAKRRFVKGCEIHAKIWDHEHIVTYYEHGKLDGVSFCLMEYVEAPNLKELYARQDVVLQENIAQILIDMAEGLEHMHQCGFMHLDFKPENVLVTANAAVKLVDFDLSQPIPEKPTKFTKTNPGTPAYMAPEQLQGEPITQHVDIFAFGVTAYELLTNTKPFPGETPTDILQRQKDRSEFVEPSSLNSDIPAKLENIIVRCLENEPHQRPPYLGVLVRELKDALYVQ